MNAVSLRLAPDVVVAAAVRVGPRDHLDIDTPPARCAVLLQDVRESRPHVVQEFVQPGDVLGLGDADAIRRVHAAPDGAGVHVEIFAEDIDLVLRDDSVDRILNPLERLGIAVIDQLPVPVLRMRLQDRRGIGHAFRLKPEQELQDPLCGPRWQSAAGRRSDAWSC